MTFPKHNHKTIWAVGGGKGGTGKSFLSANLSIALGSRLGDVIIIDADLGGPNLHTVLAVKEDGRDLGDFLKNKYPRLEDVLTATPYPGLRLVRGGESSLFMSNLNHYKKLKLIRQIKSLPARRVMIDLGTGSAFNTLDLFILAKPGILVVTPEPTAIENAYYFLKSCAVRILRLYLKYYKIPELEKKVTQDLEGNSLSFRAGLESLASVDGTYGPLLLAALKNFKPGLIVNKARGEKDFLLGSSILDVVRKYFLLDLEHLGTISYDERVHRSLKTFEPFILAHPESEVAEAIKRITERLAPGEQEEKDSFPMTV